MYITFSGRLWLRWAVMRHLVSLMPPLAGVGGFPSGWPLDVWFLIQVTRLQMQVGYSGAKVVSPRWEVKGG